MDSEQPIDPAIYDQVPSEAEVAAPDALMVSPEEFRAYWNKRLTGFSSDKDFDFRNPEHLKITRAAQATSKASEAILKATAPMTFLYNNRTMAIGLLDKIHREVVERAMDEGKPVSEKSVSTYKDLQGKLAEKVDVKELQAKIQEDFARIIVDNFDKIDATSNRNEQRFIGIFQEGLAKQFPGVGIKIERDGNAYNFQVADLTYVMVFPNSPVPPKYQRAYKSAPSLSRPVKENKLPAVIFTTNLPEGEYLVVREGRIEV